MGVPSGSVDLVTVAQALHWCAMHQSPRTCLIVQREA